MSDEKRKYYTDMFKEYPDILKVKQLKEILGVGGNKIYNLLRNKEVYSKRIGNNYIIPKISVIEYLMLEKK